VALSYAFGLWASALVRKLIGQSGRIANVAGGAALGTYIFCVSTVFYFVTRTQAVSTGVFLGMLAGSWLIGTLLERATKGSQSSLTGSE
jgi:hypothetical protein